MKVVARIRYPQSPGGFHNTFAYKHSDGRVLYFATVNQSKALVYDLAKVVSGATREHLARSATVPNPTPFKQIGGGGYHDFYVGYDPATHQDKFYGAGLGGYSVWDVTQARGAEAALHDHEPGHGHRAHVHAVARRTLCGDGDGVPVHAAAHLGSRAPARPGKTQNIDMPISAWTADWRDLSHNHEVRWPYVFVSAYEDGLQVFDLKDPKHPKTDGHWFTCECEHEHGFGGTPDNGWQSTTSVEQGAFGVDVRNYDGLIVLSDMRTRPLAVPAWTASTAGTATTTACRTSRACRTGITARKARPRRRRRRERVTVTGGRFALGSSRCRLRSRCSAQRRDRSTFRSSHAEGARGAGAARARLRASRRSASRSRPTVARSYDVQIDARRSSRRRRRSARITPTSRGRSTTDLAHWDRLGTVDQRHDHRRPRRSSTSSCSSSPPRPTRRRTTHAGPTVLHGTSPSGWLQIVPDASAVSRDSAVM